jgi:hypothetical protein
MKRGIEKTAHQTATDKNENLTASTGSANPNVSGLRTIHTFNAKRKPPPRYPREKPSAETESILSSDATPEINAS